MPRPITKFALTIPHYNCVEVVKLILEHELLAKTFIISTEQHLQVLEGNAEDGKEHVHAYFELPATESDDETALPTIRERLCSGFQAITDTEGPAGFDIQACKHPDKWIKYITKVSFSFVV